MSWVRIDDGAATHPKLLRLSDRALRVWLAALCWASRHETDGAIPRRALGTVAGGPKQVAELVAAGLWEIRPDGWEIHDYLAYNPSRAERAAQRESTAKRVRGWREKRAGNGVTAASSNAVTNGVSNASPVPSRPDPTTPPATPSVSSRAREARPSPTTDPQDLEDATLPSAEDASPSRQDAPGSRFVARTPPDPSSEARPVSEAPSPPADDRETVCPLDLVERCEAAGIPGDVAARHGCSAEAVRGHVREVRDYWTVGPGAGKRRRHWLQVVRARLHELGRRGDLRDAATLAADEQRRHPDGTPIQPGKADGDLSKYKNVRLIKALP